MVKSDTTVYKFYLNVKFCLNAAVQTTFVSELRVMCVLISV